MHRVRTLVLATLALLLVGAARLRELGVDAKMQVWAGERHVIQGPMNGQLMRRIEAYR